MPISNNLPAGVPQFRTHQQNPGMAGSATNYTQGGSYREPWQTDLARNNAGAISGKLATAGPGSYDSYKQWGGEPQEFSKVTPSPVYSPELINQATNSIWGSAMAGAANQQRQSNSLRPGFGSMSPFLSELNAGIQARAGAAGQQGMIDWQQNAAQQNAANILKGQQLRLGAEMNQAQANQNMQQLMAGVRGQDVQNQNALYNALASFTQPLQYQISDRGSSGIQVKYGINR